MELVGMDGFNFNENTVSKWKPHGVHVMYNINFVKIRVHTGSQWGGRPDFFYIADGVRSFLVE